MYMDAIANILTAVAYIIVLVIIFNIDKIITFFKGLF